jgi:hypothetical protein
MAAQKPNERRAPVFFGVHAAAGGVSSTIAAAITCPLEVGEQKGEARRKLRSDTFSDDESSRWILTVTSKVKTRQQASYTIEAFVSSTARG